MTTTVTLSRATPSPGQLVTVRHRRFVVTGVDASSPQVDLYQELSAQAAQHLVSLQSVEDDGHGEELQVVWELELGAHIYEKATLPDPTKGFDEPRRLDAFLDAVRWGAIASADQTHLTAPFRAGITIEDYQLDPVVRALSMPRVSLLIADDVGLGKTIEAGLVIQELLLRHRARSVLVVCPAGLQLQWRDQMRDKFGLEFRIIDSDAMKDLRRRRGLHVNPWTHFPRLITSIDFLKREQPMRLMQEILPADGSPTFPRKFDLLIVDEAHNVAPSGRGSYAVDSGRTLAIRALTKHFEHKLFLTATPHNGYTESFGALLELLDDQRFARSMAPDKKQLGAVMVRRLKRELTRAIGGPRFPARKLEALEVRYTAEERDIHGALREYTRLRIERAADASEKFAAEFVLKLLKKRLFSCPEAFRITLGKHLETVRRGKEKKREAKRRPIGLLRREVQLAEEDSADDELYEDRALEVVGVTSEVLHPLSAEENELLDRMTTWAGKASGRADGKAKQLLDWVESVVRPGGTWNDERVIVFTEYRATQNWLEHLFAERGLTKNGRLLTLFGGMPVEDREAVKNAFQAGPDVSGVRILLATDAASEGIDLQRHCHRLVHYEIPWNPNRMEQRNGRIDRHGQRAAEVLVYHFVGEGYSESRERAAGEYEGDLEFLFRAAKKVTQIRDDLGSVGEVIAEQVEEAMVGQRRFLEADARAGKIERAREVLRMPEKLKEELRMLADRLHASRRGLRISAEHLKAVVDVGLELAGHPALEPVTLPASATAAAVTAYRVPALGGTWAVCAEGLAHPHTGEVRPIVFDHGVAGDRDDVVLAHLGHRLVQMSQRLLREEVWAPEGQRKLHRVSARVVGDDALAHAAVLGHARLVVLGADGARLHEEIVMAGGALPEGGFKPLTTADVERAWSAFQESGLSVPVGVTRDLAKFWPDHTDRVLDALERRRVERHKELLKELAKRAKNEAKDVESVLRDLDKSIRRELERLDREPPTQTEFAFTAAEKEQVETDRKALEARLASIPMEIERETEAIARRYAEPDARLFPVAITYAVPARLTRGAR